MSDDELTLTPEYRFEWSDGTTRETTDPSFTTAPDQLIPPEAIEVLAIIGEEDPECEVKLIGMGG